MPTLCVVLTSVLAASMIAFLLKVYQERSRAMELKRQGFVSVSELLPFSKNVEAHGRQCHLTIPYSATY